MTEVLLTLLVQVLVVAVFALRWIREHRGLLRCLVCSKHLPESTSPVVRCGCRVRYSTEMLEAVDPASWEEIRRMRQFSLSYRRDTGEQQLRFEVEPKTKADLERRSDG